MTDSPSTEPDIEDREANIRHTVEMIVDSGHEAIYERLDKLHKRNIHDSDVMRALRALGFGDVADGYEDWAEIEPEDDNTTLNPAVPDPGTASSYAGFQKIVDDITIDPVSKTSGVTVYTGPTPTVEP